MKNDAWFSRVAVPQPEPMFKSVGLPEPVEKIGWTDEARAAAAEARRSNGGVHPPIDHAVYNERQRFPKYTGKVSPLNAQYYDAGKMLKQRMPDMSKIDHATAGDELSRKATAMEQEHSRHVGRAMGQLGDEHPGPLISGVVSDKFDDATKDKLRGLAGGASKHKDAAMAHYAAAGMRIETGRDRLHGGFMAAKPAVDGPPKVKTYAEARAAGQKHGFIVRPKNEFGEYRVNLPGRDESSASYHDDLQDAVDTGHHAANRMGSKPR